MKLRLAISPCPNDTFMFYRLLHNKAINNDFSLDIEFADIEDLNNKAISGDIDVCKISVNAYPKIAEEYQILSSGSALGRNCGPLLIARSTIPFEELSKKSIAIPGINTTAHFLLEYAFPGLNKKKEVLFSDIENRVLDGTYDCGLIIHENRFTYQNKGLVKIIDLGEFWENKTGFPIPLGCIVVKRSLDQRIKESINFELNQSIQYAFSHPEATMRFVALYAQEMDQKVMQQHIELYVNDYSLNLGIVGKKAIKHLFNIKSGLKSEKIFLQDTFIQL